MKHIQIVLLFSILGFTLSTCNQWERPTLERIENVNINEFTTKRVSGTIDMILKNHNPFELDLASTDLVAIHDNIEIAKIKQTFDTKMPGNAEFKMPIKLEMDLEKLYKDDPLSALGKGMQIYSKREIEIQFKGTIEAGKGAAKLPIPIDRIELVKF